MQTLEFTDALTEIVKALKAEEIVTMIQGWFGMQFAPNQPPVLADQAKDTIKYGSTGNRQTSHGVPSTHKPP
jgi:hypothetical protein